MQLEAQYDATRATATVSSAQNCARRHTTQAATLIRLRTPRSSPPTCTRPEQTGERVAQLPQHDPNPTKGLPPINCALRFGRARKQDVPATGLRTPQDTHCAHIAHSPPAATGTQRRSTRPRPHTHARRNAATTNASFPQPPNATSPQPATSSTHIRAMNPRPKSASASFRVSSATPRQRNGMRHGVRARSRNPQSDSDRRGTAARHDQPGTGRTIRT